MIAHRHMQRKFDKHRAKFDKHRAKGPMFAQAIDDLERRLFGKDRQGVDDSHTDSPEDSLPSIPAHTA